MKSAEFLALAGAAGNNGTQLVGVIEAALDSAAMYTFGELLSVAGVAALANSADPRHRAAHTALTVFAFGTLADYLAATPTLPALSAGATLKLRHLTLVTLARRAKSLPYHLLLQELNLNSVRELEDVIIEAVYRNIIVAKLDQLNKCLEVRETFNRDVSAQQIVEMTNLLQTWAGNCGAILTQLASNMDKANAAKALDLQHVKDMEKAIEKAKSEATGEKHERSARNFQSAEYAAEDGRSLRSYLSGGAARRKHQ